MIDFSMLRRFATRVAFASALSVAVSLGSTYYISDKISELESKIETLNNKLELTKNAVEPYSGISYSTDMLEEDKMEEPTIEYVPVQDPEQTPFEMLFATLE